MATRAYKMTIPLLKSLCDLFDVDRIPVEGKAVVDKDTLIDRLLDFLGAPDTKYLKTPKKKVSPKKRKISSIKSKTPTPKKKKVRKEIGKKAKQQEAIHDESETEDEMDVDSEMDADSEESEEEVVKMPTDKLLRKWVRAYVNCFNLDKATTKHAIETASDRFGVDLSGKKARIKELLTEEMS
uniref:DEK-C domain-containing protein n=2 Tax=Eucampia antarctica TaxID=49252 RepID=A0A7S2SBY4_9STRA|mmetsp:Transcript_5960/g.5564  ORF Transcript_5960/g.5564 Transcript_5960/m.5564 type:complete len:183 (+) Transcript_5960:514-1062(+)